MCGGPLDMDAVKALQKRYDDLGLPVPKWLVEAERILTPDTFPEDWAEQPEPQRELIEV